MNTSVPASFHSAISFRRRHVTLILTLALAFVAGRTMVVQTVPTITSSPPVSRGVAAAASNASERRLGSQLEGVPVPFVANEGQTDKAVAYYAPTFAGTVFVTRDGRIVYSLPGKSADQDGTPQRHLRAPALGGWSLTEAPVGATGDARPAAQKPAQTKINYLHGNDSSAWKSGIATYEEVSLGQVWPGVGVTLRAHGKNVEKVFTVEPGRDPSRIRMRVSGARSLTIDDAGALIASTDPGDVSMTRPVAYQEHGGTRRAIAVAYQVRGDSYGFHVGAYDPKLPLVIDPLLQATFLGGSDYDYASALALGPAGDVYVAGSTQSSDFPGTAGGVQQNLSDGEFPYNAFVAHLSADLTHLYQATYLGGNGSDSGAAVAISPFGDVYVAGSTNSTDFPGTVGGVQPTNGGNNAYVAHLTADLGNLAQFQATYLGGTSADAAALAISSSGDVVYVAGRTKGGFPGTAGGVQSTYGGGFSDAFVARLPADLRNAAQFQATYLGGTGVNEQAFALAIHPTSGAVYVAGYTDATDFPGTAAGAQPNYGGGGSDGFVARLPADLTDATQFRATYVGGSGDGSFFDDLVFALTIHPISGDVYVAGQTRSMDFPWTAGGAQTTHGGGTFNYVDGFVARLPANLTFDPTVSQATYVGGSEEDYAYALAIHSTSGEVYVAGYTSSWDFPGTAGGAADHNSLISIDGFVARLAADLRSMIQATYMGAPVFGYALAIYPSTHDVYFAGQTNFSSLTNTAGGAQPNPGSSNDAFVARFSDNLAAGNCSTITLSPSALPRGVVDAVYPDTVLTPSGGTGPYTFLVPGLPAGMTATPSVTGGSVTIGGTPTVSFDSLISVTVNDSQHCGSTQGYFLTVSRNADLSINVTAASPVTVGGAFTYTVIVHNNGPHDSTGGQWTMSDTSGLVLVQTPSGCQLSAGGNGITCLVGPLAVGAQDTYFVDATPQAATTLSSTFSVSGNEQDPNSANNSTPLQVNVARHSTTTSVPTSSNNSSIFGDFVTFSAMVTGFTPIGGTFTFYDGVNALGGTVDSAGVATLTTNALGVGPHSITGAYAGDSNNLGSTSTSALQQTVRAPLAPSLITLDSQPNPSYLGQTVTFTATVTGLAPTGTVTFISDGVPLQSVPLQAPGGRGLQNTAIATFQIATLGTGTRHVTAAYSGDSYNLPSATAAALSQVVSGAKVSGTAARAILTGVAGNAVNVSVDKLSGHFGADSYENAYDENYLAVGNSFGAGFRGPTVSASSLTGATLGGIGTGAARAVGYRTFINYSQVHAEADIARAIADGSISVPNLGHARVAVYVIDMDAFLGAVGSSGLDTFLLGADTLDAYAAGTEGALSLARLFPSGVLGTTFQTITASTPFTQLDVNFIVAPLKAAVIIFDITVYSPPGTVVDFSSTLKPAPVFLTDLSGNPSTLTPADSVPPAPAPTALTLSPAATTAALTTPVTVTATATSVSGAPVPNATVFFAITSGPNAQPVAPAVTDADGRATFTYAGGSTTGTDQIQSRIGALQSNLAQITWTPGPLDHMTISPASATIAVGGSQAYKSQSLDVFNNSIGDVTAGTTFSISPDGSCAEATCTASVAGPHTVTATYGTATATATLNVNSVTPSRFTFQGFYQPIDMSTPSLVMWNTVKAGQAVPVKWLLTLTGTPVSDPASFVGLSSYPVACSSGSGSIDDAIEQTASGNSGLQYNGDGNWQFNWQTLASYKSTCRAIVVKFSDGTTSPSANFKFK